MNDYSWHIGFYVRSMIYSSICHVVLYYDESISAYQYCYKKSVNTYKFEIGSTVAFKKYNFSLETDEFYPLNEISAYSGRYPFSNSGNIRSIRW